MYSRRRNKFILKHADVLFLLAEFKSYATATWQNIKNSPKFIQQFKNYLVTTDITSIEKLAYVVNTTKATQSEIKLAFKELFLAKKEEIFDVIWNNPLLRNDLFEGNGIEISKTIFTDLINGANNNKLYNFIKTE